MNRISSYSVYKRMSIIERNNLLKCKSCYYSFLNIVKIRLWDVLRRNYRQKKTKKNHCDNTLLELVQGDSEVDRKRNKKIQQISGCTASGKDLY